jgi:hypothetical protein
VRGFIAVLVAFVLILSVGPSSAQSECKDPYLIDTANQQFGCWKLGMRSVELANILIQRFNRPPFMKGLASNLLARERDGREVWGSYYHFYTHGFWFQSIDGQVEVAPIVPRYRVFFLAITRRHGENEENNEPLLRYRTEKDIRIGDTADKLFGAYGKPNGQWTFHWSDWWEFARTNQVMVWTGIGLYVETYQDTVDVLGIYDPRAPWRKLNPDGTPPVSQLIIGGRAFPPRLNSGPLRP